MCWFFDSVFLTRETCLRMHFREKLVSNSVYFLETSSNKITHAAETAEKEKHEICWNRVEEKKTVLLLYSRKLTYTK